MTTNGTAWDACECGKKGFKEERRARAYVLGKKRLTEPDEYVECPVGSCFHVFNPTIRDKQAFLKFLTETAASPKQPRPALPPSRPLTHSLPLARARVVDLAASPPPPPTPSPASTSEPRSCAKVRYASEEIALLVLESMPEGRGEQRAYECRICGEWHLTSHEHDPSQIVEEKIMAFGHEPYAITVVKGRYPDGKVASLTLRNARAFVRIRAENLPQLVSALVIVGALPPPGKPQAPDAKISRPTRILEMLAAREMTTAEIADELGVSTAQTRSLLAGMSKDGRVEKKRSTIVRYGQNVSIWSRPKRSSRAA